MKALVDYLTISCTGTGQATFYNSRADQEKALNDAHGEMLRSNRRLYALSALLPVNDRSKQIIVQNLLGSGKMVENSTLEGHVIGFIMSEMQFNRILNLFIDLRERKVNNKRVRNMGNLIWTQVDAFRAIKYAGKIRVVLRHCHIPEGSDPVKAEIHKWLFNKIKKADDIKFNPKLVSRLKAKTDYNCLFDLPYDIARDIAVNVHKKKVEDFDREFAGKGKNEIDATPAEAVAPKGTMTRKETMRARKTTGDTAIDFARFTLFELLMHAHKNEADVPEVMKAVKAKGMEIGQTFRLPERVALVIDNSISALGSAERRYQPLANMESIIHIFRNVEGTKVDCFYVGPPLETDKVLKAEGCSNLRIPLVQALKTRPQAVIILSDGYENVRAGSVNQILASKAVINSGIHVLHMNPVAAAEAGSKIRELAKGCRTLALPAPEQLPMVALIGIAAAEPKLLEPMFKEMEAKLLVGNYRGAKNALRSMAPALSLGDTQAVGA